MCLKSNGGRNKRTQQTISKEYTSLRLNILDSYDGDLEGSQVEATLSF